MKKTVDEHIRLIHEDQDKFIFETIRTYTDGVLAHEGIFKIPKKLLERAITCFKMEHPAEFELLLNGDEGMKQKIVEGNKSFHCGVEESGGHAYNCNDCPNKCEEWHQWDKEFRKKGDNGMNCDLSKFEPPKAEPDGYTKKLFGMPYKTGETEALPINENIAKGFEEFTKMMFKQGQIEREKE